MVNISRRIDNPHNPQYWKKELSNIFESLVGKCMNKEKLSEYKTQLTDYLKILEDVNNDAFNVLNAMMCDNEVNGIAEDIHDVLDCDFCRGEQHLKGFLEVCEEIK